MSLIHRINIVEDVALFTLDQVPAKPDFLSRIFKRVTDEGINVDMISQTVVHGEHVALSFTVDGEKVAQVLALANRVKEKYPTVRTLVSNGNVKISLYSEQMPHNVGVAYQVFDVFAKNNVDVQMTTTSETDISVLVSRSDYPAIYEKLCQEFGLPE